jgi:hypothetical protein
MVPQATVTELFTAGMARWVCFVRDKYVSDAYHVNERRITVVN